MASDRRFVLLQGVAITQTLFGIAALFFLLGTGLSVLTLGSAAVAAGATLISMTRLRGKGQRSTFSGRGFGGNGGFGG